MEDSRAQNIQKKNKALKNKHIKLNQRLWNMILKGKC